MKIFISQPMNGLTHDEIIIKRRKIVDKCYKKYGNNVTFLSSYFQGVLIEHPPLYWLSKSLELLAEADLAVFTGNWRDHRGCRIEHMCAKEYGIPIVYM